MPALDFLHRVELRPVRLPSGSPFAPIGLALGQGRNALEVLVVSSDRVPNEPRVRTLWKGRHGNRPAPLLLVVLSGKRATLCGILGDDPPVYPNVETGQAERICREALEQPDRHAALRSLRDALPSVGPDAILPGIRNEGFLSSHELARGARQLASWNGAQTRASGLLGRNDADLLNGLGFELERCDQATSILRTTENGTKVALAVLLQPSESPDINAQRFTDLSPVAYAMTVAERENLPYVVVVQGRKLRLYPVRTGFGVAQRGRTDTFVEIHTGLLKDTDAGFLWLLFSADALIEGGSLDELMVKSRRFAGNLAERLRERIYGSVVPTLAEGIAAARGITEPTAPDLAQTYEMALTVLFRLLFIAYAEDKDLLPYSSNGLYQRRSLKTKARELMELSESEDIFASNEAFGDDTTHWEEVDRLFRAVNEGNRDWGVPPYDGGLFIRDPEVSEIGDLLARLTIPDSIMGPVLRDLLLIQSPEGWGPVDFRSLGVREFGTIYEGLLESELAVADQDLATATVGSLQHVYRPAGSDEETVVKQGRIYLHNRSGQRKVTGTYFTKSFVVEHLLKQALVPALDDHLARLDAITNDDEAADRFFDFRVADLAMGSGHFLVAAVDHLERGLTQYLSKRRLPEVRAELLRLRQSAEEALGPLVEQVEIDDSQLLRRLIARRCIYGVDLNPVAVSLARLSIWIHTFVPGLPLSLLDHNLVTGNSLVGIGRISELRDIADPDGGSLFALDAQSLVGEAIKPLDKMARIADATASEVRRARKAMAEASDAVAPAAALCDIAAAARMRNEALPTDLGKWNQVKKTLAGSRAHRKAVGELHGLEPLHFPVAFPEVFLRERAGFDVIIGNPPWEEATLEEHAFWARQVPGLRGLSQRQQETKKAELRRERPDLHEQYDRELAEAETTRKALTTGPYPGMGTGDPDLYKAFGWRFWHLLAGPSSGGGGWLGVVLPRSVFSVKGSTDFRLALFKGANPINITTLVNKRQWVFPDVHPQYSICLVAICRRSTGGAVAMLGPFTNMQRFDLGIEEAPSVFSTADVLTWTDTASLPLLPSDDSLEVFTRLRSAPRLDTDEPGEWRVRPHTELHATNDKGLLDLDSYDRPRGFWPVYKGESFDLFDPDRGDDSYYAWVDPSVIVPHLNQKRTRGKTNSRSVWYDFSRLRSQGWWNDKQTLPCYAPRIAFRDVSRATDSRTVRCALIPANLVITNQAPFFLWMRGDAKDQAFLLGTLASLPLDWYARRFVETHLNFYVINPFPIPRPRRDDPLWRRTVQAAGRLAAPDKRFADWATEVGVDYGPLGAEARFDLICELDAATAHLYGLDEKHLTHIFETFHEGWGPGMTADHPTLGEYNHRLLTTRKHYRSLAKEYPTAYQRFKSLITVAEEAVAAAEQQEDGD